MLVEIQIVSTPLQFGAVLVSQLPFTSSSVDWLNIEQQCQAHGHLMDVGQQNSMELLLPYLRPTLYHDLDGGTDTKSWRVVVRNLVTDSITEDAPKTITFNVFASFVAPQTAGFLPDASFQSGRVSGNPAANAFNIGQRLFNSGLPILQYLANGEADLTQGALLAAGAGSSGGEPHPVAPNEDNLKTPENMRLALMGNVSVPTVQGQQTISRLGDCRAAVHSFLPSGNRTMLHEIAEVPVITGIFRFDQISDIVTITAGPFPQRSHSEYLSRMFKFFKGDTRVMLKFYTSPMVSARFKIMLFPVGSPSDDDGAIGDVPSWIVSVKGSEEMGFQVPYLQQHAWSSVGLEDYVTPVIKVQLLDDLPPPFDAPPSVYMVVFQSAADMRFAGLQSAVPAQFQSGNLCDMMSRCERLQERVTSTFPYQGGVDDVYSILGRFSSRGSDPSRHFPFPLKITNDEDFLAMDNFDYLCNLYKFYTGDTQVKLLFSKAPASGVIQATIGNTEVLPAGDDFKAGNGIVLTHQAVWPSLEFAFPYMCVDEFNSLWETEPMYPQFISSEAVISNFLIAMTDKFRVFWLLPVPDYIFDSSTFEDEQPAVFQSISRLTSTRTCWGVETVPTSSTSYNVAFINDSTINGKAINMRARLFVDSSDPGIWQVLIADSSFSSSSSVVNALASTILVGSGFFDFEAAWFNNPSDILYLSLVRYGSASTSALDFAYNIQLAPLANFVGLTNPQSTLSCGGVQIQDQPVLVYMDPLGPIAPVEVKNILTVESITDPIVVEGVIEPVGVFITEQPISVIVSNEFPLAIEGRVQGVEAPDTPVWVSEYFST